MSLNQVNKTSRNEVNPMCPQKVRTQLRAKLDGHFEENKTALISDINKSTFIVDFGSVQLQYNEILDEVADDDQNTKSKFEWMNMLEHESLMSRRKGCSYNKNSG